MCSTLFSTKNDHIDPTCHVCFFGAKPLKSKLLGQVFHLYKRCADNGTLLLSYGFCVPQNPHDGRAGLLMNKMNGRIHVHHIYIYIDTI